MPITQMNIDSKPGKFTKVNIEISIVNPVYVEDIYTNAIMDIFYDSKFFKEVLEKRVDIEKIAAVYNSDGKSKLDVFQDALKIIFSIVKLNPKALDYPSDDELF